MVNQTLLTLLVGCLLAAGCASSKSLSVPKERYVETGAIYDAFGSASFDRTSVRGARINMSERTDGTWAGTIADLTIDVNVYPDHIVGALLRLDIEQTASGYTIIGLLNQTQVHFEVKGDHFLVRTQNHGFVLPATGRGRYGPLGEVRFEGDASQARPPNPQMALALVAAFLDDTGQSQTYNPSAPYQGIPQGSPEKNNVPETWNH